MCEHCKRAGRALALDEPELAAELHGKCPHPTQCTCQHRLTSVLNRERVKHAG